MELILAAPIYGTLIGELRQLGYREGDDRAAHSLWLLFVAAVFLLRRESKNPAKLNL